MLGQSDLETLRHVLTLQPLNSGEILSAGTHVELSVGNCIADTDLSELWSIYAMTYGSSPWNEGAISTEGQKISLAEYLSLEPQDQSGYSLIYPPDAFKSRVRDELSGDSVLIRINMDKELLGAAWGSWLCPQEIVDRIYKANYEYSSDLRERFGRIKDELLTVLKVLGKDDKVLYVDEMFLAPAFQGQGLGRILMTEIVNQLNRYSREKRLRFATIFFRTGEDFTMGKIANSIFGIRTFKIDGDIDGVVYAKGRIMTNLLTLINALDSPLNALRNSRK